MIDFPTSYTLAFVRHHLPAECHRLLEVGSGDGHLARALLDLGYDVIGIEADANAVAAARQLGVSTYHARWPHADVSGFDAVIFTRSLHHIHPLQQAVDRAWAVLNAGGRIIIEDFGYDEVDQRTIDWFAGMTRVLMATGALDDSDSWLRELAGSEEASRVWTANHDHDLNTVGEIEDTVGKRFGRVERASAAYFFRYLSTALREDDRRRRIDEAVAQLEESLAASGAIQALGQRFVAQRVA